MSSELTSNLDDIEESLIEYSISNEYIIIRTNPSATQYTVSTNTSATLSGGFLQ
jgi:hypothetical protein